MMSFFVNLHNHSEYSQLDGLGHGDQYAAEAKRLGQQAVGLSDHGNVDGLIKFQKACAKHDVIPVLGCELYVCQDIKVKDNQRYHLVTFVRSREGLTNLLQMLSIANLEGFYKRPRIDPDTLLRHTEGLVFTTACVGSFINMPGGEKLLRLLKNMAPTFLEIMPHNHPLQLDINRKKQELSEQYNIPLIATNDCHYPFRSGVKTQEVLLAIQRKAKWNDPNRWKFDFTGLHLRSAAEMEMAFERQGQFDKKTYLDAMARTMEVVDLCNGYTIEKLPVDLPKVYGYEDRDETELLWEIIADGWSRRPVGDYGTYESRVNEEFNLIVEMGFQRYFLIVWELINWCKKKGIMTGPGRGSSGGSLVCYLLGITDVDPIKYGLIFARFISPERRDLPDIDMDFEDHRREEVKQHLRDCYGEHNVTGLSTFTSMKGRGALRNVARVFEVPLKEVDLAAKAIVTISDGDPRANHSIEDSLKTEELKQFQNKYPDVVRYGMELEGQVSGSGQHAAASCLSHDDLRDGLRCNLVQRSGVLVANWEKSDAEYMGLMKLDILGLAALSILNGARKMILDNLGSEFDIQFDQIPLNDQKIFREISLGNTAGAFQINSHGLTGLCKDMKVKEFNDIVLATSLFRPGPLGSGMVDEFLKRRRKEVKVSHLHPKLAPYTKESLGIVIYQEQVMWVMYELAGLPWGVCEKVRKVMGKSKGEAAFQEFKDQFVNGCVSQKTISKNEASHVWDMLSSHASYSFNKAHATEYSLITYWMMYLKCYYPKEFLCACLTYGGKDETKNYVDEARRLGLQIELPKQGLSKARQWYAPPGENVIYAPLMAIKGIGDSQAERILSGRISNKPVQAKPSTSRQRVKEQKQKAIPRGFFDKKIINPTPEPPQVTVQKSQKSAITDLLTKAGYYREQDLTYEELKQASPYYDFNVLTGQERFSRLNLTGYSDRDILACRLDNYQGNLIEINRFVLPKIECQSCELINECSRPVQPSFGRYNIMLAGEAPGKNEDLEGIGFVGSAGNDVLWPELKKYGFSPFMFHVSNVVKCYPSKTKTPSKKHIQICSKHIEQEIENLQPIIILSFGNTGVKMFRGEAGGITELCGTTEWSDQYQCWICWCIHPASVLYQGSNKQTFASGIENFARKLIMIGGDVWSRDEWEPNPMTCPYGGHFASNNNMYSECQECQIWQQCARSKAKTDWIKLLTL
jgi:DNA polymerase III subunit alpha